MVDTRVLFGTNSPAMAKRYADYDLLAPPLGACAIGGARYLSSAEIASCSRARMRSAEPEWTMLGLR